MTTIRNAASALAIVGGIALTGCAVSGVPGVVTALTPATPSYVPAPQVDQTQAPAATPGPTRTPTKQATPSARATSRPSVKATPRTSTRPMTGPTTGATSTPAKGTTPRTGSPTTAGAGAIDPRCTTGRVLCISKRDNTMRWMVDGQVRGTYEVRFGTSRTPTREGQFAVQSKSRDHHSTLYDTPMPYAMFFSGGQAVHYSADFAARGYSGGSHGCVNVRDKAGIRALFDQVQVGDKVVVHR